jgi:hypothetical protein
MNGHGRLAGFECCDDFLETIIGRRRWNDFVFLEQVDQPLVGGDRLWCRQSAGFLIVRI